MRGTLLVEALVDARRGIIPAHAGNTSSRRCACVSLWDHPRACGEHTCANLCLRFEKGSSPRMRGTPALYAMYVIGTGIIPAHAGNTTCPRPENPLSRDHPRACGEHVHGPMDGVRLDGSSPRMRGTLRAVACVCVVGGIIPAHAGNTRPAPTPTTSQRDHPRACGEHTVNCSVSDALPGSSPRMRGTRRHVRAVHRESRIIPAHAGNTPVMVYGW